MEAEGGYALEGRRRSWRGAWERLVHCLCCFPLDALRSAGGLPAAGAQHPLREDSVGRRRSGGRPRGERRSSAARHHHDRSDSALSSLLVDESVSSSERSPTKPSSSGGGAGGGMLLTPLPTPLLPPPRSPSPDTDSLKPQGKCAHIRSTSLLVGLDDEECCPTCLEEYTDENPKIMTECNHHYHLGCIYEWMERSDRCPVCSKRMVFDEGF